MSTFLSRLPTFSGGLSAIPGAGAYARAGRDLADGKPAHSSVWAGLGWTANKIMGCFSSAQTVAWVGKSNLLVATGASVQKGIENIRDGKVLKGTVAFLVGGATGAVTVFAEAAKAADVLNSLTIAGASILMICEGVAASKKDFKTGAIKTLLGVSGLAYSWFSNFSFSFGSSSNPGNENPGNDRRFNRTSYCNTTGNFNRTFHYNRTHCWR